MKKIFLFLPLFLLLTISVFSQKTQWEDVLYLKNGSVLRGIIIEQVPGESIKIQTEDENVFSYEMDKVLRITKEEVLKKKIKRSNGKPMLITAAMNFQTAVNETRGSLVGFKFSFGSYITRHLSLGIGLGYHQLTDYNYLPLTLDLMFEIFDEKTTPFLKFNGGLALSEERFSPHLLLEPSFGVKHGFTKKSAFLLGFGMTFREYGSISAEGERKYYNTVKFSLGFAF